MTYRIGFIGCGSMAGFIDATFEGHPSVTLPYSHAAAAESMPDLTLEACADPSEDARTRFGERYGIPQERRFAEFADMLERVPLDLVSVASPVEAHEAGVLAAASAGTRGIFCEKPMAASVAEADRMIAACDRSGTRLVVAYPRRWNSHCRRVQQLLRDGAIGTLTDLVGFSRGPLLGSGTHMLDTLRMYSGADASWAVGTLDGEDRPGDRWGSGMVIFRNGVKAFVAASAGKAHLFEIEAAGTGGIVRSFDNGGRHMLRAKASTPEGQLLIEEPFPEPHRESGTVRALRDLIAWVEGGPSPESDGRSGRATLELAAAFHLSHRRSNGRVDLPLPSSEDRLV